MNLFLATEIQSGVGSTLIQRREHRGTLSLMELIHAKLFHYAKNTENKPNLTQMT